MRNQKTLRAIPLAGLIVMWALTSACSSLTLQGSRDLPEDIPTLVVSGASGTLPAVRNAFTWPGRPEDPSKGRTSITTGTRAAPIIKATASREYPAPKPPHPLPAAPGEDLVMTIEGINRKPETIQLELLSAFVFISAEYWEPIMSVSIPLEEVHAAESGVTFRWTVPQGQLPAGSGEDRDGIREYCLKVNCVWESKAMEAPAEVEYLSHIVIADRVLIDRALRGPQEISKAVWQGDKEALWTLLGGPWPPSDPWQLNHEFSAASEPVVQLEYLDTRFSTVKVTFGFTVSDDEGNTGRWTLGARCSVNSQGGITSIERGLTLDRMDGTLDLPWTPKVSRNGTVTAIGPFHEVTAPYQPLAWSDDGRYLAFVTAPDDRIWVVSSDGGFVRPLFRRELPTPPVAASLRILGWAPGEHVLRFMVMGFQSLPDAPGEDWGVLFGDVDLTTGETRPLAFVPLPPSTFMPRDLNVTEDGSHAFFRDPDDLWKVNLVTGEAVMLVEGIADDMARGIVGNAGQYARERLQLEYSPSGWHVAYQVWEDDESSLVVYDVRTGERKEIPLPGDVSGEPSPRPFFRSWTSNGLLAVAYATADSIGQDPFDGDYPAGSSRVSFYSPDGDLWGEIEHEGKTIGNWTWAPYGETVAYTVGTVTDTSELDVDWAENLGFAIEEVWIRRGPDVAPVHVVTLADQPDGLDSSLEWANSGLAIEIWYRIPYINTGMDEKGIRILPHGVTTALTRPSRPYREGAVVPVGRIDEIEYFQVQGLDGSSRVFARDPQGNETTISEGPWLTHMTLIQSDLLMVLTRKGSAGTYGFESYVYFHEP